MVFFAEVLLAVKELEYFKEVRQGQLPARIDALRESRRLQSGSAEEVGDPRASIAFLSGRIEKSGKVDRALHNSAGFSGPHGYSSW